MKYTTSFKFRLTAVTALMSLTCLVHAGSGNLQRTYQQMSGVLNTMEQQTNAENLSNTYSEKLFSNIDALKNDLNDATSLSRGAQSSGGSGLSILIELAADAADTGAIHNFSAEARDNISAELDSALDTLTDQDLIDGANDVLNVLMAGETLALTAAYAPRTNGVASTATRRNRNFQYRRQPRAQNQPNNRSGLLVASAASTVGFASASTSVQERLAKAQQGRHTDSSRLVSGAMVLPQPKPKGGLFSSFSVTKKEVPQPVSAATPRPSAPPVRAIPLTGSSLRIAGSKSLRDATLPTAVPVPPMATNSLRRSASRKLAEGLDATGVPTAAPADASENPGSIVASASIVETGYALDSRPAFVATVHKTVHTPNTAKLQGVVLSGIVRTPTGTAASAPADPGIPVGKVPPPPPLRKTLNSLFPTADNMVSTKEAASAGSGATPDAGTGVAVTPKA